MHVSCILACDVGARIRSAAGSLKDRWVLQVSPVLPLAGRSQRIVSTARRNRKKKAGRKRSYPSTLSSSKGSWKPDRLQRIVSTGSTQTGEKPGRKKNRTEEKARMETQLSDHPELVEGILEA
jgi:hypothetical protein